MPQTPRDMIERLAQERFQGRIRNAFLRSLDKIKSELTLKEIAQEIERGNVEGAVRAVGLTPDNFREMREATAASVAAGGAETGKFVPPRTGGGDKIKFQFKPGNPRAEAAVEDLHTSAMRGLRGGPSITTEGERAIREHIRAGLERGDNPRETARKIRGRWNPQTKTFDGGILGLTDKQAGHVRNAEAQLRSGNKTELRKYLGRNLRDKRFDRTVLKAINEGKALDEDSIQKMVNGYERKYVGFRAETVARDQTLSALTRGQEEALDQAVEAGHTDNQSIVRKWITAGDDRVRNAHQRIPGMNRGGVPRGQAFETPLGPLRFPRDPQGTPANTIQCRCSLAVRIDEPEEGTAPQPDQQPQRGSSATEEQKREAVGQFTPGRAQGIEAQAQNVREQALFQALPENAPERQLADHELVGVQQYAGMAYAQVNPFLRQGRPVGIDAEEIGEANLRNFARTVDDALEKLPDVQADVYRGLNINRDPDTIQEIADQYRVGETVKEAAFISTSPDPEAAFTGPIQFAIRSKRGKDINAISGNLEKEVLFKTATQFKILDKTQHEDGTVTIFMEEAD